jgi:FlaA1/EpsC-like NDP-sugar epimerase
MTRFLLSLDRAVDTVFAALQEAGPGETYVPQVPAANVVDLARALMGGRDIPISYTGIRPGEKVHEIMVSEEECFRTIERNGYYVILPVLPELRGGKTHTPALQSEYSSMHNNLSIPELRVLLESAGADIALFS